MDTETLQKFRAEVISRKNLPTIPAVLSKILALVDSEGTNARDLVDVVEHDQALTGKILRLANSAFFGQSRRVATIPRAILLLGFSTVRNLTLGVTVWDTLAGGVAKQRLDEMWEHAVAVATGVKLLAQTLRSADPDEGFAAGLLHDSGRLVLAGRFRQHYWDAFKDDAAVQPVDVVEQGTFGVDHAEVGGWLFEAWALPPMIVEAVRQHHAPEPGAGLPALLAAGNRLVQATDLATGVLSPAGEAILPALASIGITPDLWHQTVVTLRDSGVLEGSLGR
jgi:HD-like signal output (HDOD) protein